MKLSERMKAIIGVGVGLVLCLMCYSCGKTKTVEEVDTEQKQEMQLETQEVEEPEIQDESLNKQARNGEYKFETEENNNLELAKQLIENVAEQSMGDARYEIRINEENNTVMHIYHLDIESASQGVYTSQWDELARISADTSLKGKEAIDAYGLTDVNYAYVVGDIDEDKYFLITLNGEVVHNVKDELN